MATDERFAKWSDAEEQAIRAYDETMEMANRALKDPSVRLPGESKSQAYSRIVAAAEAALEASKASNPYPA